MSTSEQTKPDIIIIMYSQYTLKTFLMSLTFFYSSKINTRVQSNHRKWLGANLKATPTVNEQHHTRKQGTTLNNTALTAAGKSFTSSPGGEECHTVPDRRYQRYSIRQTVPRGTVPDRRCHTVPDRRCHTVQHQTDGTTRYSTRQTVPHGTVPDRRYHTVQYQTDGTTRYSTRQTVPHGTVSDRRCQSVQY